MKLRLEDFTTKHRRHPLSWLQKHQEVADRETCMMADSVILMQAFLSTFRIG